MAYNKDVQLKIGQRWKYGQWFIGEIEFFTDHDHVTLRVVQPLCSDPYYSVGKVFHHTMNDPTYTFLQGQARP